MHMPGSFVMFNKHRYVTATGVEPTTKLDSKFNQQKGFCVNQVNHCVKSVRIWNFSGPYSVRMWENTDQKNFEYGHFSRSES